MRTQNTISRLVYDILHSQGMSTIGLSPLRLNHPSGSSDFSNQAACSKFPLDSYTFIIPPPGQPFALDFNDDTPEAETHFEVTSSLATPFASALAQSPHILTRNIFHQMPPSLRCKYGSSPSRTLTMSLQTTSPWAKSVMI